MKWLCIVTLLSNFYAIDHGRDPSNAIGHKAPLDTAIIRVLDTEAECLKWRDIALTSRQQAVACVAYRVGSATQGASGQ
jgi:hypothetical protein